MTINKAKSVSMSIGYTKGYPANKTIDYLFCITSLNYLTKENADFGAQE
ncbi:hypothetical protein [Vibrio hepatarius]|nr:hypothetical protein [Vibrio hepatarius]MBU2898144.1 hypothetical protein [Vibrio hepatarius]